MSQIIVSDDYAAFMAALPADLRRKLSFHDMRCIRRAIPAAWLTPTQPPGLTGDEGED